MVTAPHCPATAATPSLARYQSYTCSVTLPFFVAPGRGHIVATAFYLLLEAQLDSGRYGTGWFKSGIRAQDMP